MSRLNIRTSFLPSHRYLTIVHREQLIIETIGLQNLIQMLAVGIGNEYLTVFLAGHQTDDSFHAMRIQFVEDIIQEQ